MSKRHGEQLSGTDNFCVFTLVAKNKPEILISTIWLNVRSSLSFDLDNTKLRQRGGLFGK